jgi:hypothetical protein
LIEKIRFAGSLCNATLKPPEFYFDADGDEFLLLQEVIEIRNSIIHARPNSFLVLLDITKQPDGSKHYLDDFDVNFWPRSKIPKDITSFDYRCAVKAVDSVLTAKTRLEGFIEGIDRGFLANETWTLLTRVFDVPSQGREYIVKNWMEFVNFGDSSRESPLSTALRLEKQC